MSRRLLVAFSFLTRLPIRLKTPVDEGELGAAAVYFGFVGASVGLFQGLTYWLAAPQIGNPAAAVLSVIGAVLFTGAFHYDGLADSADALVGGWDKQQRKEILKDSRLGTYGVMALILVVALEILLVSSLTTTAAWAGLVGGHTVSRTAAVVLGLSSRERGDGLSGAIAARSSSLGVVGLLVSSAAVLVLAAWATANQRIDNQPLIVGGVILGTVLAVAVAAYLMGLYAYRKIDAVTGDILGAVERLSFSLFLLGWVVLHT